MSFPIFNNAVNSISGEVLAVPFPIMLFLMGMFGPFCEEFVFRGMILRGHKKSGSVFWAIFWSSLLFGLMHMNFNQAANYTKEHFNLNMTVEEIKNYLYNGVE